MIVVAIIGILAAIALPAYRQYTIDAADNACLAEAKAYVNTAMVALHQGDTPVDPNTAACATISTATNFETPVTATPESPGTGSISCTMTDGTCVLTEATP